MTRIVVATIAVAALAGLLFTLNRIDDIALDVAASPDKLPRYTLTQADLTRYDAAGQPSMKATAATLEYFDDESATATTLVVDVLSGPKTPWHIEAPAGNLRAGSREIELTGEVVAHGQWPDNGEALVLRSPSMIVNPDTHVLHTAAVVDVDSRTRKGTAVGMDANWEKQDLRLLNNVKMRYDVTR